MDMNETPRWPGGATIVPEWDMDIIVKTISRQRDEIRQRDCEIAGLRKELSMRDKILDALNKQLSSQNAQILRLIDQVDKYMSTK